MSRSKWKGPFIDSSIINLSSKKNIKVWSRTSVVPASFIGETVLVYNGKDFKKITITRDKVGFKFGAFSFTRKNVSKIKSSSQMNLKKKIITKPN